MTITDGLRAWLNNYEGLAGDRINVDCLPARLASYSLDSDPVLERKIVSGRLPRGGAHLHPVLL